MRNAVLLGLSAQALSPSEKGHLFEQWVLLQCLYYIRSHRKEWRLSSYQNDAGAEVDIIIDTGKRLIAIEIKSGKNVTESHMRGLRSFEEVAHKPVQKYLVYLGETEQKFSKGEREVRYKQFFFETLLNCEKVFLTRSPIVFAFMGGEIHR